jgi:hypothetical protein
MSDLNTVQNLRSLRHDTDRLVVAYYDPGSGGKFILNCLGLSRHVVLQDAHLAQQQLEGRLDPSTKLTLLLERLAATESRVASMPDSNHAWQDLNLGCLELFGDASHTLPQVPGFDLRYCRFHPVINRLTHSDLYFGVVSHDIMRLSHILSRWPRARVLRLINSQNFQAHFRPRPDHRQLKWQQLRGPDWPDSAPTNLDEFFSLPVMVHQELQDFDVWEQFVSPLLWAKDEAWLQQQKESHYHSVTAGHLCWIWDVDRYTLDAGQMLHRLEQLYHWLGLDDFDPDLCSQFHARYIHTLNLIREKTKKPI